MSMPSFAVSISVLAVVQASLVALPRAGSFPALARLRGPAWAVIPAASIGAVVFGLRAVAGAAQGITYLALVAVPVLAVAALAWVVHGHRPLLGVLAAALFALAWADRGTLSGQSAALALTALSCVTLGALLAAVAPAGWLKLGIVAMAAVDTWLVATDLLQAPNDVLNAAAPAAHLPQLQEAVFGRGVMGYGDLFVAGVLGALLADRRSIQWKAAGIAVSIGLTFNLLFLWVSELPATVPIALTLIVLELAGRRRTVSRRRPRLSGTAPGRAAWARAARR